MEQETVVNCKNIAESSRSWSAALETGRVPMDSKPLPEHGSAPVLPCSSSSDEEVQNSSSSNTSSSNDVKSDEVVLFGAQHSTNHRRSTAGRGRKRGVAGRKARPRTKAVWEWSHYQDRQLKRSTSLPADVTESARLWNQFVQGKPSNLTSNNSEESESDENVRTLFNLFRLDSHQLSDRMRHGTVRDQACEDGQQGCGLESLGAVDSMNSRAIENQPHESSDIGIQQSDDASSKKCSSFTVQWFSGGSSQSTGTDLHSSEVNSQSPTDVGSKSADVKNRGSDGASQLGQMVTGSGQDTCDKTNNGACENDKPSSSESSPDKKTTSSDTSSTPAEREAKDFPTSAGSDPGISAKKQAGQADTSLSNEESKQMRQTGRENDWMHFSWSPQYGKRQYGFQSPHFFMNNNGRNDHFHNAVGFSGLEANMFPFYEMDRRRPYQQGRHFHGPCHHKGYGYGNFAPYGQYAKMYSPRIPHDGSMVFGGAWPHRGRGGIFVRGRGFNRGRAGMFKRGRAADARFLHSPTCNRRGGSKSDWNNYGRRGNDWHSNRDGQEETNHRGYWKARNDDNWNLLNNELSRGRTPYRMNGNQSAYRRHRSAPPVHNLAMDDGDFHQNRQRHRSLSRSPRHSAHKTGNWKHHNHWKFSPQAFPFDRQEPDTSQQLYESNKRQWSSELYRRITHQWNDYQNAQDHQTARNEQPGVSPKHRNNGSRLHQPNFDPPSELSSSRHDVFSDEQNASSQPDGNNAFQQQTTLDVSQQNTAHVSEPLELELLQTTDQNKPNPSQSLDKPDAPTQQESLDTTCQNNGSYKSPQSGELSTAQQQGKQQLTQQHHGPQQRDRSSTRQWEEMLVPSPEWSGRSNTSQWKDGPHISKQNKRQHVRRQPSGQQQHKAKAVQWHDRLVAPDCKGSAMATYTDSNVTRQQQSHHHEIPQQYNDFIFPQNSGIFKTIQQDTGPQNLWTAGLPPYAEGDNQQADIIWKIMQLQQQQIDQMEAEHILRSFLGTHHPSEASQKLNSLILNSLKGSHALLASQKGNDLESFSAKSYLEQKRQNRSQVSQQRNCHYLNGTDSYKNTDVSVEQQGNSVNQMEYCISNKNTNQNGDEFYLNRNVNQSFYANAPQGKHHQYGNYQKNRRSQASKEIQRRNLNLTDQGRQQCGNHKQQQQWRKHLKENRTQYMYFLDNQRQTNGRRPAEQDKTWNQKDVNQFSHFQDANGNQLYCSLPVSLQDHGHQLRTILKQNQDQQQASPHHTYARQAETHFSVNVHQPPPPIQKPWSYVPEGMKMKHQVSERQQNVVDNRPCAIQQNGGQENVVQTYPLRVVPHPPIPQNGTNQVNGNTMFLPSMSSAPPPLQFASNTSQPTQTCVNFLQSGPPLPTPMLPTPVNTPLVQHVNSPFVHPLNTPFIQPVNIPYPQQNMFQFPSPIPVVSFGNPGQVGPAPNVFQFPDTTGMQQPVQADMQVQPVQQQVKSPLDKPCGFAGNQPLVLFPPTDYNSCLPSDGQLQHSHVNNGVDNVAKPVDTSVVNNSGVADENGNAIAT